MSSGLHDYFDDARFDKEAADEAREFLRHLTVERGLSENTVRAYALDLRAYFDWACRAKVDPLRLSYRKFRRYLMDMHQAQYAQKTANRRLSAVRTFFAFLNARGVIATNPAAAASTPKLDRDLPRRTPDSAIERLLDACDGTQAEDLRDSAFLELLYASGARISELSGLKVVDVDFAASNVRLFGKGSKERIVPLYPVALETVRHYIEHARAELLSGKVHSELFISVRGNPMSSDSLRKVFKKRAAQAGLDPSLHPHDIRHAFATELLEGGADMRSVQEMLGHSSLSTTQVYTHLSMEHMKDVYKRTHPRS